MVEMSPCTLVLLDPPTFPSLRISKHQDSSRDWVFRWSVSHGSKSNSTSDVPTYKKAYSGRGTRGQRLTRVNQKMRPSSVL